MNNYTKTVVSAVQAWTADQIKQSKPDWNQNDPSAADYIKNRTHYERLETKILVDNLTREEYENGDHPKLTFVVGSLYTVIWNGTTYSDLECWYNGEWRILGDPDQLPFYIDDDGGNDLCIDSADDEDYIVSIVGVTPIIKTIDPKFLPEGGVGYTAAGGTEAILEETVEVPEDDLYAKLSTNLSFIEGKKYLITFNGELYECIAWSGVLGEVPVTCLGNGNILEIEGEYNNEPFAFDSSPQGDCYLDVTEAGTYTVKIEASSETIHKIDPKYLPEHIKSDWNENDPAAEGYIENRPFYEGLVAGDVLFEETFEDFGGGELSEPLAFIEGETYFVTFNGEEYKCIAWVDEFINSIFGTEVVGLGNTASEGIENKGSNNEPFYLMYANGATIFGMEDQGTYTLKIQSATMAVAKKIDKKFLPDDVGGINIKTAAEGDLIKVKEVDGTGKPTSYEAVSALNTLGFIDPKTGWEYVGYIYDGNWITCRKPERVELVELPNKTTYRHNESFDPTGMIITATYSDGTTKEIVDYSYEEVLQDDFEIFCIDGGVSFTIELNILKNFQTIEVASMPNKTSYYYGETFDPTGMVIVGVYENGETEEITNYTYSEVTSSPFEIYCVDYDTTVTIDLSVGPEDLRDFEYLDNNDGTYTITDWKETLNGLPSSSLIIPNDSIIIL